ncbi:hypothetical protein [Amorphus coralli]|uniref:hypothetical protein n=1 Tax=Amorphus coralli TaxID=340680 RepID=UPI000361E48C|nr:hypothetical protein [Amorphus coralli]
MAATNDPSDPKGGSGRKTPPVLDLSASEVEPRTSGSADPSKDEKGGQKDPKAGDAGTAKSAADAAKPKDGTKRKDDGQPKGSATASTTSGKASSPVPSVGPAKSGAAGMTLGTSAEGDAAKAGDAPKSTETKTDKNAADGASKKSSAGSGSPAGDGGGDDSDVAATPAPPRQSDGIGLGGAIVTAVVAAVLVVGAGYIAIDAGLLGAPGSGPRTVAQGGAPSVESRIATLERRVENAGSGGGEAAQAVNDLQQDIEGLKAQVEGMGSDLPGRVSALESQVTDVANAPPAVSQNDLQALRDGVSKASDAANQAASAAGNAAAEAGKANAAIAPMQQSIESLKTAQAALQSSLQQLSGTVSDLSSRVTELEKIVGGTGPREAAALALSTAVLDEALRTGEPYAPALAAVKTRLEDPSIVAPLDAYAETGLPTRRALVAAFPEVEDSIRDTVRGGAQDEGFMAGLLANAESLVKVRRTDAPEDGGVSATLDQIRADLDKGDLAAAASDWTKLPEPAQAASKTWHDQVAARVAADALVAKVTQDVLASLSQDPSAAPQPAPAASTAPGN